MLTIQSLPRAGATLLLCIGLCLPAAFEVQAASPPDYPVKLSADGSYLVDQGNRPFFINGDTAWSLIAQLSEQDADQYLSDRAAKGFNVVLVSLIEHMFASNAPRNLAGDAPFTTAGDFGTPNEAYFAHADRIINKAAEKGITVLLAPLYLGYLCGSEGWCAEVKASSSSTMRNYGRYVGNRYKNFPNIIWLIGGDADPVANGVGSKVQEFVAGIKEVDSNHLFTAHNAPEQAAMDVWPNESWLNLNNIYTYNNTPTAALAQYNRSNRKPFFLLESAYEREHSSTPLSLRRQAYWSVLSGGTAGHMFGNCPLWNFGAPAASGFCTAATWQAQLDSPGSTSLANVGRLFSSRAFYKLVPDQNHTLVTVGYGTVGSDNYLAAARTPDGGLGLAYVPSARTFTVDMSKLSRPVIARWYDPAAGTFASISGSPFANTGTREFTPPGSNSAGDGDWVLVLEAAASTGDFNADGKTDILWRQTGTGVLSLWLMNGPATPTPAGAWSVDSSWAVKQLADFNADGRTDILWYQASSGTYALWLTDAQTNPSPAAAWTVPNDWVLQRMGDFNGDGRADILWRQTSTGVVSLWLTNEQMTPSPAAGWGVSADWVIQALGDFDGDRRADILWRNKNTGAVSLWLVNQQLVPTPFGAWAVPSDWVIQGVGDFNGDGRADILWRQASTGVVSLWLLNEQLAATASGGWLVLNDWEIQGVGDFNGDGRADILWRNKNTGIIAIWTIDAQGAAAANGVWGVATGWEIQR